MAELTHHIQKEIINRLIRAKVLRFKDLKPDGMESNIFMYHLKQLIKHDYVAKTSEGYTLAVEGLRYADNINWSKRQPLPQPKNICIFAITNSNDEWLLAERKLQPFIGMHMLPSSAQQYGVSIEQHVRSKLLQEMNIKNPASLRAEVEVILHDIQTGLLLTHVVGQIYSVKADSLECPPETDKYRFGWHSKPTVLDLMPGTEEIIQKLQKNQEHFFFSYTNFQT